MNLIIIPNIFYYDANFIKVKQFIFIGLEHFFFYTIIEIYNMKNAINPKKDEILLQKIRILFKLGS